MSPKNTTVNKKHVAHLAKVRQQSLIIKYVTIGIFIFVGVVILAGIVLTAGFPPYQNVARVNGENLSAEVFIAKVKLQRNSLLSQYGQLIQFAQGFGMDPFTDPNFSGQLSQIENQLSATNKVTLGQQVLDNMITDALIRQEAKKRGITVSEQEIEKYTREDQFQFYADGTPTPQPTPTELIFPTLNPTQLALVTITPTASPFPTFTPGPTSLPTETPTSGPSPTSFPTLTPNPTATPYTLEGFNQAYNDAMERYKTEFGVSEELFRDYFFAMPLVKQKVFEAVTADLKPEEEQVWARHILVATEEEAKIVYDKLMAGEEFGKLARELSTDTGSGGNGGDLGWFSRGMMVQEFEDAAFSQAITEIGEPVQSKFGFHIIQVLGHENRPVNEAKFEQLKQKAIADWLASAKESASITTYDFWKTIVPLEPTLGGQ